MKIAPDNEPSINVTAANPANQPPTVMNDGPQSVEAQETKASKKETKESAPKPNQDESKEKSASPGNERIPQGKYKDDDASFDRR